MNELEIVRDYLESLVEIWSRAGVRWTMFLCGRFVEALEGAITSADDVRRVLGADTESCEIACHSYAHYPLAPVAGRSELVPITLQETERDLDRNAAVLSRLTGRSGHFGFRSPYGHDIRDFPSGTIDLLASRRDYSSSTLRTRERGVCPPLSSDRQPFELRPGFWELPSHGWHDTVFAGMSRTSYAQADLDAHGYYADLLRDSLRLADEASRPIFVGLVLHPIAMASYDPSATLIETLCEVVGDPSAVTSYREAVSELEASSGESREGS